MDLLSWQSGNCIQNYGEIIGPNHLLILFHYSYRVMGTAVLFVAPSSSSLQHRQSICLHVASPSIAFLLVLWATSHLGLNLDMQIWMGREKRSSQWINLNYGAPFLRKLLWCPSSDGIMPSGQNLYF